MPITDYYQPLDFTDLDGPGCGQAQHEASCLCDVDLAAHPVPEAKPFDYGQEVGYGRIATAAVGRPRTSHELVAWAGEMLGAHDTVRGAHRHADAEKLERLRAAYGLHRHQGKASDFTAAGNVVRELLGSGLTLATVASYLGASVDEVITFLHRKRTDCKLTAEAYLEAEHLLREGAASYSAVARRTGLHFQAVKRFAGYANLTADVAERRADGGTDKYTAHQVQRVHELREAGVSYPDIAKATGVNVHAVGRLCRKAQRAATPTVATAA